MDAATAYAERVLAGDVVAGPSVRAACRRHLSDLEHGAARGLTWHPEEVERVIGFFRTCLTVEVERRDEHGDVESIAVPFEVHESQAFILGSLFGWRRNGVRRFRRAFIEIGKGNGKSPLAAGIGLYMMLARSKLRAEVYSAATDRDQASILFRDVVQMWQRSPALSQRLIPSGQNPVWQLTHLATNSFFKPISSEKKGKSGIRPYCALIDEVHEHPDNSVIEMLRAGTKGNQEALILEITNSGFDRQSVCWGEHEYSLKVANGDIENDAWFSYVCDLDEDDDPFEDEACWAKTNPLLGVCIFPDFIREQVAEAKGMPSKESLVRRLHFCQWTDAAESWIAREAWEAIEAELDPQAYVGRRCFGGLDLSFTKDLSSLALAFEAGEDTWDCFTWFWKPKVGLKEASKRDKVPYELWAKAGHLQLTDGAVIKLGPIADLLAWIADTFDLQTVAYDRYRHRELDLQLSDAGVDVPMQEHPQGFRRNGDNPLWMPTSVQEFENAITERRLRVQPNPVLRWNVSSAVIRHDPSGVGNRIFDKRKATGRIDGVVAHAMAIGAAKALGQASDAPAVEVW